MYLFEWYADLSRTRGVSMIGPEPIRYTEIEAWCNLTGVRLEHWELRAMVRIDEVFLGVAHGSRVD